MPGRSMKLGGGSLLLVLLIAAVISPASSQVPGAPAVVVDYEPPIRIERYRVTDFGTSPSAKDDRTYKARFRVAERTGNCCENYLTASKTGRLFDQGGRYINYTDDKAATWKSVQPLVPLVNGEGTLAMGPGGDVLAVQWDPYSGDHLQAYKYDAGNEDWTYLEAPLHTPFYDRPWLSVVPGPFEVDGQEVPYVTYVDGYPHTGTLLYSTDGLTYARASSPYVDSELEQPVKGWIPTTKSAEFDWIQPNTNSPIIPLGGGRALAPPDSFGTGWSILNPKTLRWAPFSLPNGDELDGRYLVDSKGRVHNMQNSGTQFTYRISGNGGRSWKQTVVPLPKGLTSTGGMQFDFRVNARLGMAAVVLHADDSQTSTDKDIAYVLDISGGAARVERLYEIGLGDVNASSGLGQNIRLDFQTIAILPDGRIATSFLDTTTEGAMHLTEPAGINRMGPALAVEL